MRGDLRLASCFPQSLSIWLVQTGNMLWGSSVPAYPVLGLQVHLACLAFTWLLVAGDLDADPHSGMASALLGEPALRPKLHFFLVNASPSLFICLLLI